MKLKVIIVLIIVSILAAGGLLGYKYRGQIFKSNKTGISFSLKDAIADQNLKLLNLAMKWRKAEAKDKPKIMQEMTILSLIRKDNALKLAKENPKDFLSVTFSGQNAGYLPDEIQKNIEKETTVEGKILYEHKDNFENNTSTTDYSIKTADDTEYNLEFSSEPPIAPSGTQKVTGVVLGETIVAVTSSLVSSTTSSTGLAGSLPFNQKIAIIAYRYQDTTGDQRTVAQLLSTTGKFISDYKAWSYGKFSLSGYNNANGDFFGIYTIPVNKTECGVEPLGVKRELARDMAKAQGFSDANYGTVIYSFYPGCGYPEGMANNEYGNNAVVTSNYSYSLIEHEYGHTLGFAHSDAFNCSQSGSRTTLSQNCQSVGNYGYGDPFDIMGSGNGSYDISSIFKEMTGWIEPNQIQKVTTTGNYTLTPLATPTAGLKILKIPRWQSIWGMTYIYVEFRTNNSPDRINNKVFLRVSHDPQNIIDDRNLPYLLDTTSATETFSDTGMTIGQTVTDYWTGATIKFTSISNGNAIMTITPGTVPCSTFAPTINTANGLTENFYITPGGSSTVNFKVTSNDLGACSNQVINFSFTLPSGFSGSANPASLTLNPGETKTFDYTVTAPAGTADGVYPVSIKAFPASYPTIISYPYSTYAYVQLDFTPPTGSIQITGGGYYSNSQYIDLTIAGSDPETGVIDMCLYNGQPTQACTNWIPFATSYQHWDILASPANSDPGQKYIHVVLRNGANMTVDKNTSINFDNILPTGAISVSSSDRHTYNSQDYVNSKTINLNITTSDNSGTSNFRLSNDGITFTDWQAPNYSYSNWDLTNSAFGGNTNFGQKKIYMQLKDRAGNITSNIESSPINYNEITINETVSKDIANVGDFLTYTVAILNHMSTPFSNVSFNIPIPAKTSYRVNSAWFPGNSNGTINYNSATNALTWTLSNPLPARNDSASLVKIQFSVDVTGE